jgi:hypothetical protein
VEWGSAPTVTSPPAGGSAVGSRGVIPLVEAVLTVQHGCS